MNKRGNRDLLTRKEAADEMQIGLTTLWKLLRSGHLKCVRIRGSVRILRTEIDRFVRQNEQDWRDGWR